MLKKFTELFRSENLLDEAVAITAEMLQIDLGMYNASRRSLRESKSGKLPIDIKVMDQKVNQYQRKVRRNVLTHLTVAGTPNLVPGLVLVTIVIDVERIGDYTKNIAELAVLHKAKLDGGIYEESLVLMEDTVKLNFERVIVILDTQEKKLGRKVMGTELALGEQADEIVAKLLTKPPKDISVRDGISIAMYARHLKRINAHLTNVASAVVNPFPRISFSEKSKMKN